VVTLTLISCSQINVALGVALVNVSLVDAKILVLAFFIYTKIRVKL